MWLIGVGLAIFGQRWWAHDRDRRVIMSVAALFCVVMGLALVSITAVTCREEYGFGTLFGGPHSLRVLVLLTLTAVLGLIQLGSGVYLARRAYQRAA